MRKPLDPMQRLSQWLRKLESRVKTLETAPRLQNSSISKGALRILSPEGLIVVGSARISGTLNGSGTFDWTGPVNLKGAQSVTGPTTFTGKMTVIGPWSLDGSGLISGDVDITGDVAVTGDINVTGAGRIKVGSSLTLNPAGNNGRIEFANGAQVFTDGTTIQVFKGNSVVQVSDTYARIQYGGSVIQIGNDGVRMTVNETRTSAATSLPAGVLGIDGQTVFRVVA